MITATMFEAKTRLSELVKRAQEGEEVIITSGREKKPVARIEPIAPMKSKLLGFLTMPDFRLTEAFWDEPDDEEAGVRGPGDAL